MHSTQPFWRPNCDLPGGGGWEAFRQKYIRGFGHLDLGRTRKTRWLRYFANPSPTFYRGWVKKFEILHRFFTRHISVALVLKRSDIRERPWSFCVVDKFGVVLCTFLDLGRTRKTHWLRYFANPSPTFYRSWVKKFEILHRFFTRHISVALVLKRSDIRERPWSFCVVDKFGVVRRTHRWESLSHLRRLNIHVAQSPMVGLCWNLVR